MGSKQEWRSRSRCCAKSWPGKEQRATWIVVGWLATKRSC